MVPLPAKILFAQQPDLIPQFVSLARESVAEAGVLLDLLQQGGDVANQAKRAKEIEHSADDKVHDIVRGLNRLYNSAFDREDLHRLASSLDDIIDFAYGAADRVLLYKITGIPAFAGELALIILRQSEELTAAVSALAKREEVFRHCANVKQLEIDADRLTNSAVAELFEREKDAIQLIKLKELYNQLALATDRAKDAADVVETMVLKRGLA